VASHSFATSGSGRGCSAIRADTSAGAWRRIPATAPSTVEAVPRSVLVLVLALLALFVVPAAVSAAPTAGGAPVIAASRPVWPLTTQGRWITDAQGRVVILHGVDLVARSAPWDLRAAGFGDDDARLLERAGFGAVRLGVIPAAVMPRPGVVDARYLDRVAATVRLLARHGLMTLVDLYQDQWGPRFLGSGLPGWMTFDDGLASAPRLRPPGGYVTDAGLVRAFDSFWANRTAADAVGLTDRWTQIAGAVARRLAHLRSLAGYDLMNAPWPGSSWRACVTGGCPGFQRGRLARLWRRSVAIVRAVDADAITWIEPPSLAPAVAPLLLPATGDRRRSGLAFQVDCGLAEVAGPAASCGTLQRAGLDRAQAWSQAAQRPALVTGRATVPRGTTIAGLRRIADARMTSWLRWSYANVPATPGDAPAIVRDLARPATGANVDEARLAALDAPHPRLVAGTPIGWTLSHAGVFTASWTTMLPSGVPAPPDAVSDVWLGRRTFPAGFHLTLSGARVVRRTADSIVVQATPGALRVVVRAAPDGPLVVIGSPPRAPSGTPGAVPAG
jgi:endoglycosylceramidase